MAGDGAFRNDGFLERRPISQTKTVTMKSASDERSWRLGRKQVKSYHQRTLEGNGFNVPPEDALQNANYHGDCPPFLCLAPLGPDYPSNRSKWIKMFILSCRLDGEMGHCMKHYGSEHGALDFNPATYPDPSAVQITDVLSRALLVTANWNCITMTFLPV
ncbi:uncharacterized protein BDV14DRAFT_194713 [Aspergillus stella-maris]|uniref:uncharacterized protein n=1 Tax=Aspergillus stella-maris TaxID=1810926 RepID=UPI003CCD798C